ncbi:VMAP-C domain-containing protein [Paractinoplanes lichenicola]|uniref:Uncharacterized protein n=1 Tax=Paractinoplanes lichenicola TaxID=2802976 RepID=A0ABS1VHQ9_9ACTN|nr:hypothetical protein [Actinoplanes lichenicola]MBL7254242.1 hypothetical protein [Actinoplanes lichenicola]
MALLNESGGLSDSGDRDRLIAAVTARHYGDLRVEPGAGTAEHLTHIVRDCAAAECLGHLVDVLEQDSRLRSPALLTLRQLYDEWNAAVVFDDDDWWSLRAELATVTLTNLHDLYRRATPFGFSSPPPHCDDAWRMFVYLAGLNESDERVPPCTIFLWSIADLLPAGEQGPNPLRRLLDRLVRRWDIVGPFQRAVYSLPRVPVDQRWDPTLLIAIDFDRPDLFSVVSWTQWSRTDRFKRGIGRVVPQAGLEAAVQEIVATAERSWLGGDDGQLRLEFLLPFELLNLPVERWRKEHDPVDGPVPLYMHYPVVVRSLDRIRKGGRRAWNKRWHSLRRSPHGVDWLASRGADHRLEEEIQREERIVTMILSEPPPGRQDGAAREIRIAIRTGVPIVIWHRTEPPSRSFLRLVENLIFDGGMAELPDRASQLRITASMNEDGGGVGQDLVLLWDDPSRLPGEFVVTAGEE